MVPPDSDAVGGSIFASITPQPLRVEVGAKVRLVGLVTEQHLNGEKGVVIEDDPDLDPTKCVVRLDSREDPVRIRRSKLQPILFS